MGSFAQGCPERSRRANAKFGFIVYSVSLFLLFPTRAFSREIKDYSKEYAQLIHNYKECMSLEEESFKRLTFKLSSSQLIKTGGCPKLILEDNLGIKWMFKASIHGRPQVGAQVATVVYHIFKLFGLDTPEIHPLTLKINDEIVYGDIQRFIPNQGTLLQYPPSRLSLNCSDYLLKTHIFYWFLNHYDANPTNFIVTSLDKEGNAGNVMRIDNENAFLFLSRDKVNSDYEIARNNPQGTYYYQLWQAYRSKEIDLDLEDNYAFVQFVQNFPDSFFERVIMPVITGNFDELSQTDFNQLRETHKSFFELIFSNKHNLSKDFAQFYKDLAITRNKTLTFRNKINHKRFITQITEKLNKDLKDLTRNRQKIEEKPASAGPIKIDAIISFEGFKFLDDIYTAYWAEDKKDLIPRCDYALKQLVLLESASANKYEKTALRLYREEIEKIRGGEKPSFLNYYVNKVVDPVPSKELR